MDVLLDTPEINKDLIDNDDKKLIYKWLEEPFYHINKNVGALVKPNCMARNSKSPYLVLNVVIGTLSSSPLIDGTQSEYQTMATLGN